VTLAQKLRYLRLVEGQLRNLDRPMTQSELSRALRQDLGRSLSQAYLSQLESGVRPHMTNTTRQLLARFYKVHPSYLVDDPEGFHPELTSPLRTGEDSLDSWLMGGVQQFRYDPEVSSALLALAGHSETRKCILLLQSIVEVPGLVDHLWHTLHPSRPANGGRASRAPAAGRGRPRRQP
jgi:transcriptional regulator with XRE-family HTH domain